jgi:hypothetical protein
MRLWLVFFALFTIGIGFGNPIYARGSAKSQRTEHVNGYRTKNGKYVKPYYRAPKGSGKSKKKYKKHLTTPPAGAPTTPVQSNPKTDGVDGLSNGKSQERH